MNMMVHTRETCDGTPISSEGACGEARVLPAHTALPRHIALVIDPAQLRRFHLDLKARFERAGMRVSLLRGHAEPLPAAVDLLFRLERAIHRVSGPRLADHIAPDQPLLEQAPAQDSPDLTILLDGIAAARPKGRTLRLTFDGGSGWSVLIGALIAGRTPVIELEDTSRQLIVARAVACADNAATVSEASECVLARVVDLILMAARGWSSLASAPPSLPRPARVRELAVAQAKGLAQGVIKHLYRLCCHAPHWRTCWRFVDGPDLWATRTLSGTSWNILPDPGLRFYADPFPFVHEGKTYLFLEDFDHRTQKAVISVVPFDERGPAGPATPVLEEPWHLSYPFVFSDRGQIWMIPESSAGNCIALYRAVRFPNRWIREATLVCDIDASDATVAHHGDRYWMFAAVRNGAGSWSDALSIFSADNLHGPWQAHPANPVLIDQSGARPAGAMFARDGRLWRPVQDCTRGYGTGIGLAEVVRLDDGGFEQRIHATLRPQPHWPGRRLHTLNRAGRLECIDGSAYSPRNPRLARLLQERSGRREQPDDWRPMAAEPANAACSEIGFHPASDPGQVRPT